MKRTGPTNPYLEQLVNDLKKAALKEDAPLWRRIANDLEKPTRQRRVVNIYKIDRHAKNGETLVVPGKVLGVGDINRKVRVAAFTFSRQALDKINKIGGQAIRIEDVLKENPKGKNVRILG